MPLHPRGIERYAHRVEWNSIIWNRADFQRNPKPTRCIEVLNLGLGVFAHHPNRVRLASECNLGTGKKSVDTVMDVADCQKVPLLEQWLSYRN